MAFEIRQSFQTSIVRNQPYEPKDVSDDDDESPLEKIYAYQIQSSQPNMGVYTLYFANPVGELFARVYATMIDNACKDSSVESMIRRYLKEMSQWPELDTSKRYFATRVFFMRFYMKALEQNLHHAVVVAVSHLGMFRKDSQMLLRMSYYRKAGESRLDALAGITMQYEDALEHAVTRFQLTKIPELGNK